MERIDAYLLDGSGFTLSESETLPILTSVGKLQALQENYVFGLGASPMNVAATIIFVLAVLHILFARRFTILSKKVQAHYKEKSFVAEMLHFLGEVEIIFGIWVVPLVVVITYLYNWPTAVSYLNSRNYGEAIAVVIIMTITSSYPIVNLAERILAKLASLGNSTPQAWWFALLTVGPILGAFIAEAGAMILTGLLLARKFYQYKPSEKLCYATLGVLMTNISLAGIITIFASPPALMAAKQWHWTSIYMFDTFGIRSILSIIVINVAYMWYFRQEFKELNAKTQEIEPPSEKKTPPFWVTLVNTLFLIAIVYTLEEPVVFVGLFFFFLGFYQATSHFQGDLNLRAALLVGFFIAGLVIHATLQQWWIAPLFDNVTVERMMAISLFLGPITDNAALVYLATLIPHLSEGAKYAVMVGAVVAGGLTVIANAPNPAGQQILGHFFKEGISARGLFLGALPAAFLALLIFYLI